MITVSVVIPAYNCASFIERTISAAIAQSTHRVEVEVIVVDDGSSDATAHVVGGFGSRVRYLRQSNAGVSAARNAGFAVSSGSFVCFLDADDVVAAGWFEHAITCFENEPELGVVFGRFRRWSAGPNEEPQSAWAMLESELPTESESVLSGWIYHHMLFDSWILCSAALIRREVVVSAGGFEVGVPMGEDWEFWIRVSRICPVRQINRFVVLYRQHPEQATRKIHDKNFAAELIKRNVARYGLSGPNGDATSRSAVDAELAKHHYWHSIAHFEKGRYGIAVRELISSLRYQPWHVKRLLLLLIAACGLARPFVHYILHR